MSVFTCLEVPCLAPNYCLGADSDEMWYVATPHTAGILSFNPFSWKKPSCSCSLISSKRPGWSCHMLMIMFTFCILVSHCVCVFNT